jgi:hypothetical protein
LTQFLDTGYLELSSSSCPQRVASLSTKLAPVATVVTRHTTPTQPPFASLVSYFMKEKPTLSLATSKKDVQYKFPTRSLHIEYTPSTGSPVTRWGRATERRGCQSHQQETQLPLSARSSSTPRADE